MLLVFQGLKFCSFPYHLSLMIKDTHLPDNCQRKRMGDLYLGIADKYKEPKRGVNSFSSVLADELHAIHGFKEDALRNVFQFEIKLFFFTV